MRLGKQAGRVVKPSLETVGPAVVGCGHDVRVRCRPVPRLSDEAEDEVEVRPPDLDRVGLLGDLEAPLERSSRPPG